jgi:TPR repeat protein
MIVTPLPSDGTSCKVQSRDSGIRNSPVGTLVVTTYGSNGLALKDHRQSEGRCQPVNGVGQMAELCVLSDDYDHYRQSLVVYRNEKKILQLDFFDWPSPPNSAFAEARTLAKELLGAYADLPTKEPAPGISSPSSDKVAQIQQQLLPRARSGGAQAQFALGVSYQYAANPPGTLTPDYRSAAYWYGQAANQHVLEASYALGVLYRDGQGVARNEDVAIRYLKQAADGGHTPAMLTLAMIYARKGIGWSQYYLPLLERAEQSGSGAASNEQGVISYEAALHEGLGFAGFRQADFAKALTEFKAAAALGDCDAPLNLGGMYFNGDGVPQSAKDARSWFLKVQDCKGASAEIRQRSTEFLAKVQAGRLPAPQKLPDIEPPTQPTSAGMSQSKRPNSATDALMGAMLLLAAVAFVEDATSTPEERKAGMERMRDLQRQSAEAHADAVARCESSLATTTEYPNRGAVCNDPF